MNELNTNSESNDESYLEAKKILGKFVDSYDESSKDSENSKRSEESSDSNFYDEYQLLSAFVQGALWMRRKLKSK
jgi:hypothetical protein